MDNVFSGHQPNFAPYLGVFYKIYKSDVFVLDDDVQYSNDGLHNSNFIKVGADKHKITVPVNVTFGDAINEAKICYEGNCINKLLKTIKMNYNKCDHFDEGYEFISRYLNEGYEYLCDMNIGMIKEIVDRFGIKTDILIASKDVPTELKNNERNVYQCLKLNGNIYYSGQGGKAYNDEQMYADNGIRIEYSDYKPFEYKQKGKNFIPNLSVLDYIMNVGFSIPKNWQNT